MRKLFCDLCKAEVDDSNYYRACITHHGKSELTRRLVNEMCKSCADAIIKAIDDRKDLPTDGSK